MEHRALGRAGLKVSTLTLGAMTFGESRTFMKGVTSDDDEAAQVLDAALEAGITLIDTADVYSEGRSEAFIGERLGKRRQQVLLATKCRFAIGPDHAGPNQQGLSRHHIMRSVEESLRRLKTDVIDLFQVHMQDGAVPIEETLRALDDLVTAGKIRYVGCSNYTGYRLVESLWAADRRDTVRYDAVQLQWSLVARDAEREMIPACRTFGLGVLVWSPLGRGFLSGKYRRGEPPPLGSRLEAWQDTWHKVAQERHWATLDVVRGVAEKQHTSPAAVALSWVLARRETSSVIIGARTVAQLRENLRCLEVTLDADDVAALDKVSEPEWGYPYDFIGSRERW